MLEGERQRIEKCIDVGLSYKEGSKIDKVIIENVEKISEKYNTNYFNFDDLNMTYN